jgi:UDP-glucose 4-epimerase
MNGSGVRRPAICLTGGLGYIGSHVAVSLLRKKRYRLLIIDNLSNAFPETLQKIQNLSGADDEDVAFYNCDIRDDAALRSALQQHSNSGIHCCIHFAALKNVFESTQIPLEYYDVNLTGTITLVKCFVNSVAESLFSVPLVQCMEMSTRACCP